MKSSHFIGHNDINLHVHESLIEKPKADLVFLHGFFEHSGRYAKEAKLLNSKGYNFYAYDQRSHGQSDGKYRSYVGNFDNYLSDYKIFLEEMNIGEERPYYLMSHSMGGLVLTSYLLDRPALGTNFRGTVMSAPLIMPDRNTAPLLQKILFPRLRTVQIDSDHISRDPQEIKAYVEDPLNSRDKMYAASGHHLIKQMKKIQPLLPKITTPFLVLHGTDDRLAEIEGSRLLYNQASSEDKKMVELADYKHEILKDIDNDKVWEHIISWMDQRLA